MKRTWVSCLGMAALWAVLTPPVVAQNQDNKQIQVQPKPADVQPKPAPQPTQPAQPTAEPARQAPQPGTVQPAQGQQPAPAAGASATAGTSVQGKIVRMEGTDKFVVRTGDNREVTFVTNPQTRYMMNNRAVRFNDLRVGADISTVYTARDNVNYVDTVTIGGEVVPAAPPPAAQPAQPPAAAQPTIVEGTIVRVVGKDQVIVRTADGREVIVYVNPQTKYLMNDRPVEFTEFRAGAPIRVDYDVRDRRFEARRILGLPRR